MESAHVETQQPEVSMVKASTEPIFVYVPCPRCERRKERERGYAREARKRKKLTEVVIEEEDGRTIH
jgi:hypothetical protein